MGPSTQRQWKVEETNEPAGERHADSLVFRVNSHRHWLWELSRSGHGATSKCWIRG
jgi:hypothetical protein